MGHIVLHASAVVTSPAVNRELYEEAKSEDKTIKVYEMKGWYILCSVGRLMRMLQLFGMIFCHGWMLDAMEGQWK